MVDCAASFTDRSTGTKLGAVGQASKASSQAENPTGGRIFVETSQLLSCI